MREPAPQLLTPEETELVEHYRACCPHHRESVKALVSALYARCSAADAPTVVAFIKTLSGPSGH